MTYAWVVPLDGQLDLLEQWLEPILERHERLPLQIVLHETEDATGPDEVAVEPFDALVGPVRVEGDAILADVVPVEPFVALRERLGATDAFTPTVVLARGPAEPIEANASAAILVTTLHRIRTCS